MKSIFTAAYSMDSTFFLFFGFYRKTPSLFGFKIVEHLYKYCIWKSHRRHIVNSAELGLRKIFLYCDNVWKDMLKYEKCLLTKRDKILYAVMRQGLKNAVSDCRVCQALRSIPVLSVLPRCAQNDHIFVRLYSFTTFFDDESCWISLPFWKCSKEKAVGRLH